MSAKSFWNWVTNRMVAGTPDNASLFGFAPQPGVSLVTEAQNCTAADIVAAGGIVAADQVFDSGSVIMTDAQIKAANPITIVAGIPGIILYPLLTLIQLDNTAGAYTNIDAAAAFALVWSSLLQGNGLINQASSGSAEVTGFFGNVGPSLLFLQAAPLINQITGKADLITGAVIGQPAYAVNVAMAATTGKSLLAYLNNQGSGALTGGNAANRMGVRVKYLQITPVF